MVVLRCRRRPCCAASGNAPQGKLGDGLEAGGGRGHTPALLLLRVERPIGSPGGGQDGGRRGWFASPVAGQSRGMRFGNVEVHPLGGGLGCLFMVLFSVIASVVLTVLVNLLLR